MYTIKEILYLSLVVLIIVSCRKEEETAITFEDVIAEGGGFELATTSEEPVSEETSVEIINGEVWNCPIGTYDAMAPGGGNNGFPLFHHNASVIYPGSLVIGWILMTFNTFANCFSPCTKEKAIFFSKFIVY
ncbi:MAG: hypothetical protein ACOCX0_03085 [Bacteroidota bacterium]